MGVCRFLYVSRVDMIAVWESGDLWVFIGVNGFSMRFYVCLLVSIGGSMSIGIYRFLWVLMGFYGVYGSIREFIGIYG